MYIKKRYPLTGVFKWSRRYIYIFLVLDTVPIALYKFFGWDWLVIPWQPIALIGIAVSFYLGFKNNSSYDRLWEARKIWGGIVNSSRTFTIMTRDFITNEHAHDKIPQEKLSEIHKTIIHRHVAWLNALSYQLRKPQPWEHDEKINDKLRKEGDVLHNDGQYEKLKPYLSTSDYEYIMKKGNRASHILSLQSKSLLDLKLKGLIEDFRHMELSKMLGEFYTLQGKSERIKNFPFPRQYATVNYIFVWIFLILIPFGMLNVFSDDLHLNTSWLSIPFTMLVSWVFILMEMIGDYSENPFEGLYNDVPITSMSRGIEIDIRQMLEETDLPSPTKPIFDDSILL